MWLIRSFVRGLRSWSFGAWFITMILLSIFVTAELYLRYQIGDSLGSIKNFLVHILGFYPVLALYFFSRPVLWGILGILVIELGHEYRNFEIAGRFVKFFILAGILIDVLHIGLTITKILELRL